MQTPDMDALKRLANHVATSLFVVDVDRDGTVRYTFLNAEKERAWGIPSGVALGRRPEELFPSHAARTIIEKARECADIGIPTQYEERADTATGTRWWHVTMTPLTLQGQTTRLVMGTEIEITERKLADKKAREAEYILEAVFTSAIIGICLTDSQRRVVRINKAFTRDYGWQPGDLIGRDFNTIIQPIGSTDPLAQGSEWHLVRKDGSAATVFAASARFRMLDGSYRITTLADITERKHMEQELIASRDKAEMANRAKSQFLTGMSHELRTPLNAIIGFSEIIEHEFFGSVGHPKYREYASDIRFSGEHLLSIVNDILDMSKIEAGKLTLHDSDIDIHALCEAIQRMMAERAHTAGVTMKLDIQPNIPMLRADERLMRQVLLNLVGNAIKFTDEGGHITLSATHFANGWMVVSVSDTGRGMPTHRLDEMLQPFVRLDDPVINRKQGTGLGLPLAKAMVEAHGGTLHIDSALNVGTTIMINMPPQRMLTVGTFSTSRMDA